MLLFLQLHFSKLTYYTGLFLILEKRPFTTDDGLSEVEKCQDKNL
jgi:hypothetical protein